MPIVHMQPLVSSLSANDCLVQPLRKDLAVAQDSHLQRVTIPEVAYVQSASLTSMMMGGIRSKHVGEFNLM